MLSQRSKKLLTRIDSRFYWLDWEYTLTSEMLQSEFIMNKTPIKQSVCGKHLVNKLILVGLRNKVRRDLYRNMMFTNWTNANSKQTIFALHQTCQKWVVSKTSWPSGFGHQWFLIRNQQILGASAEPIFPNLSAVEMCNGSRLATGSGTGTLERGFCESVEVRWWVTSWTLWAEVSSPVLSKNSKICCLLYYLLLHCGFKLDACHSISLSLWPDVDM